MSLGIFDCSFLLTLLLWYVMIPVLYPAYPRDLPITSCYLGSSCVEDRSTKTIQFCVLFYCYFNFTHPLPHLSGSLNPKRGSITSTSLASARLVLPAASHATTLPNFSLEIIMEAYFEMDNHGINKPQNVGQDSINGRPKRRRVMTDRRRDQNRQAQKTEWLRAVRFEGKNHCPVEASTRIRLVIYTGTPI
jgi:hypothetical protein